MLKKLIFALPVIEKKLENSFHFVRKKVQCSVQIQLRIAREMTIANHYSIEVDTTQDIAVIDQLVLCVRYVFEESVKIRLLRMINVKKSTGEAL